MNKSNLDDIFVRSAMISLLEVLSTELYIEQTIKEKTEKHQVKFMVSAGNSEQFMKDFFLGLPSNICPDVYKAEGNYETLPFGVIHIPPQIQIKTKDLTNKFIRAEYTAKETDENNKLKSVGYNARLMAIPITITFKIEIRVAQLNQLFKVLESVMDTFFQTRVKYFIFKGIRMAANLKFPEQMDIKKIEQFDFMTADNYTSLTFNVEMDTHYPSYDKSSTLKVNEKIERFNTSLNSNIKINDQFTDQDSITDIQS